MRLRFDPSQDTDAYSFSHQVRVRFA
ncbi:MAG: hypothetical protein QOJ23_4301, partial [Actinomycetota bacterium]|nr:hypothetical protein [Actinomycetota bacterium]